jgi:hypothetical protein
MIYKIPLVNWVNIVTHANQTGNAELGGKLHQMHQFASGVLDEDNADEQTHDQQRQRDARVTGAWQEQSF